MNKLAVTQAVFLWIFWAAPSFAQAPLFAPGSPVMVARGSGPVLLADISGDKHLDLVTKHMTNRSVSVLLGDGRGHFARSAESSLSLDFDPAAIAVADVNDDEIPDLAVAHKDDRNENVSIFLGSRTGGFKATSSSPFHMRPSAKGYKPTLRFVDLNEDGKPDLISANGRRNSIETLFGDGRGGFAPGPVIKLESGTNMFFFELGDVDGDGHLDLVTARSIDPPQPVEAQVMIRRGDGKGGFADAPSQTLLVPPDARVEALADLNGDHALDIVLCHGRRNILTVLLNDGKGTFPPRPGSPIEPGMPATSVVAADINGDKNTDLVIATVSSTAPFASKIAVLLGDGRAGFAPAAGSPFAAGPGAYSLAVRDVNEDGKLDIAASSFESNALTILLGR